VPTQLDGETSLAIPFMCQSSSVITSSLMNIPNEPATFYSEWPKPKPRSEDSLLAFCWRHFVNGSSPYWLARMPMTKAVVRAMDTVQAFIATQPGIQPVKRFLVAGASKRGWTTWYTNVCRCESASHAQRCITTQDGDGC
jgi:PhoPQ-activated pathogenicity-related protein